MLVPLLSMMPAIDQEVVPDAVPLPPVELRQATLSTATLSEAVPLRSTSG
jgi:hypothetical protein